MLNPLCTPGRHLHPFIPVFISKYFHIKYQGVQHSDPCSSDLRICDIHQLGDLKYLEDIHNFLKYEKTASRYFLHLAPAVFLITSLHSIIEYFKSKR